MSASATSTSKTSYADGLAILRRVSEDENNWRAGMQQIGALLVAAEDAGKTLAGQEKRKSHLESEIARLEREMRQREAGLAEVQTKVAGLDAELTERQLIANAQLGAVTDKMVKTQTQLREMEESLARIAEIGATARAAR